MIETLVSLNYMYCQVEENIAEKVKKRGSFKTTCIALNEQVTPFDAGMQVAGKKFIDLYRGNCLHYEEIMLNRNGQIKEKKPHEPVASMISRHMGIISDLDDTKHTDVEILISRQLGVRKQLNAADIECQSHDEEENRCNVLTEWMWKEGSQVAHREPFGFKEQEAPEIIKGQI